MFSITCQPGLPTLCALEAKLPPAVQPRRSRPVHILPGCLDDSKRRPPQHVIFCLNKLREALFSWIWTPSGRWCRCSVPIQQVFAAVTMARSIVWIYMRRGSRQVLQIGRMMPRRCELCGGLLISMQMAALLAPGPQCAVSRLSVWH